MAYTQWYKEMAVYQIWPRSFCDGNGDGIGDLWGVLEKLDYIKSLNVDAIWFSPLSPSPNADYGYDIADYKSIHPDFGDLELFRRVLEEAHKRGLKVFMDLVVNHSSDEHPWFRESRSAKDSPYHDYYYWRPGRKGPLGKRLPPNNWTSLFEGGAWEYDSNLDEYYLHLFAKKQPDLNMSNPKVRAEVKDILRFWLDLGVDGFREDVITFTGKAPGLPNSYPKLPIANGMKYFSNHMEADCFMTDMIRRPFDLKKMKRAFSEWQYKLAGRGWNALYIENHDHARIISRYGSEEYPAESGKMLAAMYILQRGTPFIYQGQEIGMTNIRLPEIGMYKDVASHNNYRIFSKLLGKKKAMELLQYSSRENARTPVQWDSSANAGFSSARPWFSVNPNYTAVNVAAQEADPDSLLNFYRSLLSYRKSSPLVLYGEYRELYPEDNSFYAYERSYQGKRLLVICHFSSVPHGFMAPADMELIKGRLLFSNYKTHSFNGNGFIARPWELRVYDL